MLPNARINFYLGVKAAIGVNSAAMKSPFQISLSVASLILLPICAPAALQIKVAEQFARYDANQDGKLSPEEVKAAPWAALLEGADADGDKFLTTDEIYDQLGRASAEQLRAAVPSDEEVERRFKAGDKNQDGQLSAEELGKLSWLLRMDRNDDGLVSWPEIKRSLAKLPPPTSPEAVASAPPPPFPVPVPDLKSPRILRPAEHQIGRRIALDASWKHDPKAKVTVLALVSTTCPVSKRYVPELQRLAKTFSAQGVEFHFLTTTKTEDPTSLNLPGQVHAGENATLLAALGATCSTDTFVLDAAQTLVYRGAIDDQYGLGYSKPEPSQRYLVTALQALLSQQEIIHAATEAPGCALEVKPMEEPTDAITYHNRVSRIIQANCLECHHQGGVAPFALETLDQVKAKAGMIRKVISSGAMPPWMAEPLPKAAHSLWERDRSLVSADRAALLAWLDHGKPEGAAAEAPLPRSPHKEWMIGTPEVVYQIPQPIAIKAEGIMPYQNVTVETLLKEDRWVQAWEVQPSAREVVHHVLVFVKPPDGKKKSHGDAYLAAFVPGNNYVSYPPGYGKYLPAGSRLRFQIHYTPNGTATTDQVKVGLKFTQGPAAHVVEVIPVAQPKLRIPAGAANHAESATTPVPVAVELLGFMPHMHVRGKSFRYDITLPTGETQNLLNIPRYDFNWQIAYRYQNPPILPAGSKIKAIGWYDNSTGNPANPDATRTVTWGEQTTDEMMIGYVEYALVK